MFFFMSPRFDIAPATEPRELIGSAAQAAALLAEPLFGGHWSGHQQATSLS